MGLDSEEVTHRQNEVVFSESGNNYNGSLCRGCSEFWAEINEDLDCLREGCSVDVKLIKQTLAEGKPIHLVTQRRESYEFTRDEEGDIYFRYPALKRPSFFARGDEPKRFRKRLKMLLDSDEIVEIRY